MPFVPTPEINVVEKKYRKKLLDLTHERSVMGYTFSFTKLLKVLTKIGCDEEEALDYIQSCIVAFTDEEARPIKNALNESISAIFAENGITSLRDSDPFGNRRDYIYMESTSSAFNKSRCMELAPKYGVDTDVIQKLLEAATTKTPYTTLQCRSVKENGKENGK